NEDISALLKSADELNEDISALLKSADELANCAEITGELTLLTMSNSMRKSATNKSQVLNDL
ncbi:hypothetical protein LSAT2_019800, partial [Lamellibrachia satsuma]